MTGHDELDAAIAQVPLVDHHVHGAYVAAPDRATFGNALNEADTSPLPPDVDPFDSQLGFAIRAWCAPLLDMPAHASPDDYWERRSALGEDEVNRRFLTAAGVSDWLLDTGLGTGVILDPAAMADLSGAGAHEIVRLESVAEQLRHEEIAPAEYPDAFRQRLRQRTAEALGTKSILAYRSGFRVDLRRPTDTAVRAAYGAWGADAASAAYPRLVDPTLMAFGIHEAIALGLPVQFHVGLGDRDMDLADSNPLLLTDFLRLPQTRNASILLLHCYPFEREAGYLAQGFANVYLDVGLAVNYLGAQSAALIARSLELAPFGKLLYSSDAYGPAELHYLGAQLWRDGMRDTLTRFVDDGHWSLADAIRVTRLIGRDNVLRAYPRAAATLADPTPATPRKDVR